MARMRFARTLFFLLLLAAGAGALVVFRVPLYKQVVKRCWRDFRRPAVPAVHTEFVQVDGRSVPQDPPPFVNPSPLGPNLHFKFPPPGYLLNEKRSPAIIRVVSDVADSLISISAGITFTCADRSPDLRICMRLDHADNSPAEWTEKRLLAVEHHPNEAERFNFEWLMRDLPVRRDDRMTMFLRNSGGADVSIAEMDVVYRSAAPLRSLRNR